MNTTKDVLKDAPGYKYDRTAVTWVPENSPATTGTLQLVHRDRTPDKEEYSFP
jgi:hypothetical protein